MTNATVSYDTSICPANNPPTTGSGVVRFDEGRVSRITSVTRPPGRRRRCLRCATTS
jgi:hypothetical protein